MPEELKDMEQTGKKKRGPRSNQKLKIMYLAKILLENTDEEHALTLQEIIDKLKACNVTAERKSLYDDIEQLNIFGIEVQKEQKDKSFYYRVANRQFELAELKLLVDSVQSAKFITEKKSNALIKKLESLASKYEASKLQRQVFVSGRVKTVNESILINVDTIHSAINENRKITFQYYDWNVKKERVFRHDGKRYEISPWELSWDDENYYLVAYDSDAKKIKYYRVDKMYRIDLSNEKREGRELFANFDMAEFAKKTFAMFEGEEQEVKLLCENQFAGVMIDRFGKDVRMIPEDEEHFVLTVKVAVSRHFLGWVFALGKGVTIIGSENVLQMAQKEAAEFAKRYAQQ